MLKADFIDRANKLASVGHPFLFITDFEQEHFHVFAIDEAAHDGVIFDIRGMTNIRGKLATIKDSAGSRNKTGSGQAFVFESDPVDLETYNLAFDLVRNHILHGNTFLLNLTFPTKLSTNLGLDEVFRKSRAPYKLLFKDQFVVFSPECFVKIRNGYVYSYPMKGTIDASIPDARKTLMENEKEQWEHNTIVDLIRNDLSIISKDVKLTRYRYVEQVKTNKNVLLQASSEIRGRLEADWKSRFGELFTRLLPAGSVSGAPKPKTMEIIREAEQQERGYFTGVFGIFDGEQVDSGVMIRFIEKGPEGLRFRSGGGITGSSDPLSEYREMINKVYVPIV